MYGTNGIYYSVIKENRHVSQVYRNSRTKFGVAGFYIREDCRSEAVKLQMLLIS